MQWGNQKSRPRKCNGEVRKAGLGNAMGKSENQIEEM